MREQLLFAYIFETSHMMNMTCIFFTSKASVFISLYLEI